MAKQNYREASREQYAVGAENPFGSNIVEPLLVQIQTGALQRLADAQERVAAALEAQNTVLVPPQTAHLEILARHEPAFRRFIAVTSAEWEWGTDLRVVSTKPAAHESMVLVEVAYPQAYLLFSLGKLWESVVAEGIEEEGGVEHA